MELDYQKKYPKKSEEDFALFGKKRDFYYNFYCIICELNMWDFVEKNAKVIIREMWNIHLVSSTISFLTKFGKSENYKRIEKKLRESGKVREDKIIFAIHYGFLIMSYIVRDGFSNLNKIPIEMSTDWF